MRFYLAEPQVFLTIGSIMMQVFCFKSILFKFACRYEFNATQCSTMNRTDPTDEVVLNTQSRSSTWTMMADATFGLSSIVASSIFGSLSDGVVNKRNLLVFLSLGATIGGSILIGVASQKTPSIMMPVGLTLFQLISGFIASSFVLISTANGYLSAVTAKTDRAIRFSCLELSFFIGQALASTLAGVLTEKIESRVALAVACSSSLLGMFYAMLQNRDSRSYRLK
ncbi:hypothetical protein ACOME3_001694 [Neoechinorhynchus agilis]